MGCNMPKPDSSRHLTFATNPHLGNFIGKWKIKFFMQIYILVIHKKLFLKMKQMIGKIISKIK